MGKAFEKQMKIIEDQGEKQVEFLKEQTKAIEGKPNNKNNQSRSSIVFDDFMEKRKNLLSELYESVGMNELYFEYVGNTKDVSIYEYMDSKELFSELKDNFIRFNEALKRQEEFLKKINEVKVDIKTPEQEEVFTNLENFTNLEKKFLIFLDIMLK